MLPSLVKQELLSGVMLLGESTGNPPDKRRNPSFSGRISDCSVFACLFTVAM